MTTRTASRPNCFNIQSVARFLLKDCHNAQPGKTPALAGIVAFAAAALLTAAAPISQAQTGPVQNEVAKLLADDGDYGDQFGFSVAIEGDTAVVGAFNHDDNGLSSLGATYIFVRNGDGVWTQETKLLASDGAASDAFGTSVAISGETVVVGAPGVDTACPAEQYCNSGAAYVFERDANGAWTQRVKLLPFDGMMGGFFGGSVAIASETIVVGANGDNGNEMGSGSAYVFTRDVSGVWTQQDKLLASDGATGDGFGASVAIDGDTAVIGAIGGEGNVVDSGSAYVFVRDPAGDWTQQTKLFAIDGRECDYFGDAVALSGDTAVVGAMNSDGDIEYSGSAYIFVRDTGANWTQQAKLVAADPVLGDKFGIFVDISDETVVVGKIPSPGIVQAGDDLASRDTLGFEEVSGGANAPGTAYVFKKGADGIWTQRIKLLSSDGSNGDDFGISVGLAGDTVVVGARFDEDNGFNSGSAYIFNLRPADLNANGVVDGDDLSALLSQWETDGTADLNSDGVVDGVDLATLLTNWG